MADVVTCTHCGKPIERETLQDGDRCPHCGEALEAQRASAAPPVEHTKERTAEAEDFKWLSGASIMLGFGIFLISSSGLAATSLRIDAVWLVAAPIGALLFLVGALTSMVNSLRLRRRMDLGFRLGGIMFAVAVLLIMSLCVLDCLPSAKRCPGLLAGIFLATIASALVATLVNTFLVWARIRVSRSRSIIHAAAFGMAVIGVVFPVGFFATDAYLRPPNDCGHTDALSYCRNISWGIGLFHKDTGTWPIYTSADHSPEFRVDFLYGNMGEMPEFSDEARESWGTRSEDMYFILVTNGRSGPWYRYGRNIPHNPSGSDRIPTGGWAEPYLPYVTDDPWGYAYLVSVSGFEGGTRPDNHVWCLSAGVNGIVDTPAWATATRGDDVGYRYK